MSERAVAYRRDGVAVLPAVLDGAQLELLAEGVEYNRTHPSPWAHWYTDTSTAVGFWSDYVTWPEVPAYEEIGLRSVLPTLAAELMGSQQVRFFHEHVLVKEPGAVEPTPWHHDQPYYCVDGDQSVSFWIALDAVPEESALRFIAGSHLWGRWFVPRRFVDHVPYADAQDRFEILPEFDDEIAALGHTVISTPVEPGDIVAFHFRTVHSAPGNLRASRRRAVSFRYVGDDATTATRPWLHSPPFDGIVDGAPLDGDGRFPVCFPAC
jgi:ectoine hydroxylase-related dioxygenase (phytanoyl-CoA dioxygenase family)